MSQSNEYTHTNIISKSLYKGVLLYKTVLSINISISTDIFGEIVLFLPLERTFRATFLGCAELASDRVDVKVRLSAVEG